MLFLSVFMYCLVSHNLGAAQDLRLGFRLSGRLRPGNSLSTIHYPLFPNHNRFDLGDICVAIDRCNRPPQRFAPLLESSLDRQIERRSYLSNVHFDFDRFNLHLRSGVSGQDIIVLTIFP